jgi:O-antigen/teichoic acid export membrane protein/serine acetyltransferase
VTRSNLIAKNVAFLLISQVVTWTFSLLFLVVVPRAIGPAQWGEFSLASAINSLACAVLGLSMNTLLVREIASDRSRGSEYVGAALGVRIVLALPLVLVVAAVAALGHYGAQTRTVIGIATLSTLVGFLTVPFGAGLMAYEQMHFTGLQAILGNALISVVGIALIWLSVGNVVTISVVGLLGVLLVGVLQIYWLSRTIRIRIKFDPKLMRMLVLHSLPFAVTALLLTFYTWIDFVMLSFMAPDAVVGWYGAAGRILTAMLFVPTTLTTASLPALSYHFKHDRTAANRLIRQSFSVIVCLGLPIAIGTIMLAPNLVRLLYGSSYAPSGTILMVLGLSVLPTYVAILVYQILVASNRQVVWTRVMGVMCVVNPLINLATISYFQQHFGDGAMGAAWALVATEGAMGVFALAVLPRGILGRTALRSALRAVMATGVMAVVVWPLRDRIIVLPVGAGTLVFFAAALAFRVFPPEDLRAMRSLAALMLRRVGLRYRLRSTAAEREMGLPLTMLDLFVEDLQAWKRNSVLDATAGEVPVSFRDALALLWSQLGVRATWLYRLSAEAWRLRIPLLVSMLARRNIRRYGLDIAPETPIGPGLYIPHPVATVVRARAIGHHCRILSAVVIGTRDGCAERAGPVLGDNVLLGAGARVLGGLKIGDSARIGANAVVLDDVPNGATVVGIPARVRGADTPLSELVLVPVNTNGHHSGNGNGNGHHHGNGAAPDTTTGNGHSRSVQASQGACEQEAG